MRTVKFLGGAAAFVLMAAPAFAQPAPAPAGPPPTSTPDSQTTPSQTTNLPQTPQPEPAPAAAPAPPPSTDTTIPGATPTSTLTAADTPDQPSRLYVIEGTSAGGSQVQIVTNGPVPDTPENRKLYRPLSRAGRHQPVNGH